MKMIIVNKNTHKKWKITSFEKIYRKSGLFFWQLQGDNPKNIMSIHDPWKGNSENFKDFDSKIYYLKKTNNFSLFYWIRDVRDYNKNISRNKIRNIILDWFERHNYWNQNEWRPDFLSQRISNLMFTFQWFGNSADDSFQQTFLKYLLPQFRCLSVDWEKLHEDIDKLDALKSLIVFQSTISNSNNELNLLLEIFSKILERQLNLDGGHKTRQPEVHLKLIKILIECRMSLSSYKVTKLKFLDDVIRKAISVCKVWIHGNGEFAHFNFAGETKAIEIKKILEWRSLKFKIPQHLKYTGFTRFYSGRNTLIFDTGSISNDKNDCPASALAFEFSVGKSMLVVNSSQNSENKKLRNLLSQTIAHSTLSIDNLNSKDFINNRFSNSLKSEVGEAKGGLLLSCSHNGYMKTHGIIHTRKMFLANDGKDLRGNDHLEYNGAPGEIPSFAIVRFHLHPHVSARISNNKQIILKIRTHNSGWLFKTENCKLYLDKSIYLKDNQKISTQQIILQIPLTNIQSVGNISINWAFKKI